MLTPYLLYIKIAAVALLLGGTVYGTWYVTADHYQKVAAQLKIDQDIKSAAIIAKKDAQILQGATEHATNQGIINSLSDAVHANSLRIKFPTCSGNTKDSANQDQASGVLPDTVDSLFADLQERVSVLVREADQINIDAINSNEGNK